MPFVGFCCECDQRSTHRSRSVRYFSDFIGASAVRCEILEISRSRSGRSLKILGLKFQKFSGAFGKIFNRTEPPGSSANWCVGPWVQRLFAYINNKFSTSAFDMQNHQLPHVDSSLLNLKICARIVIQSIPTNQLRPQNFKNFGQNSEYGKSIFDH